MTARPATTAPPAPAFEPQAAAWLGLMPLDQLMATLADDAAFGDTALALARRLSGRGQRHAWQSLLVLLVEWDTRVAGLDGRLIALQPVLRAQLGHWSAQQCAEGDELPDFARALLDRCARSAAELRRARWFCAAVQEVLAALPLRRVRTRKADKR